PAKRGRETRSLKMGIKKSDFEITNPKDHPSRQIFELATVSRDRVIHWITYFKNPFFDPPFQRP
ncbi:MAG: hypothetical protein ACXWF2_10410, partial [Usitatibacter sp.]